MAAESTNAAAAVTAAVRAEVERVHPDHECTALPPGWVAVTAPEPCEWCGTRVFALRSVGGERRGDHDERPGRVRVFHVGWVVVVDARVRLVGHTPELCREVRGGGAPLEGRRPAPATAHSLHEAWARHTAAAGGAS